MLWNGSRAARFGRIGPADIQGTPASLKQLPAWRGVSAACGIRTFDERGDAHVRRPYAANRGRCLLCCLR